MLDIRLNAFAIRSTNFRPGIHDEHEGLSISTDSYDSKLEMNQITSRKDTIWRNLMVDPHFQLTHRLLIFLAELSLI